MADDQTPDEVAPDDEQPRLSPEAIAYRSFSGARRGISETEVRGFLQEVAGELADAEDRARELRARVEELENRPPPKPRPLTEEEILDQLGEETARVLRSAQEAAEDIRRHAAEQAARIAQEAEEEADRLRAAAENVMAERSREADVAAAVTQQEADGRAQSKLRQASRDAAAEIEAARQRGREMVNEARVVRERILTDLGRRRSQLEKEVGELESARGRLLEAGKLVRRTLADATEALTPFEAVATAAEPSGEEDRDEGRATELVELRPDDRAAAELEHPAGGEPPALAPTLIVVDGGHDDSSASEDDEAPDEDERDEEERDEEEGDEEEGDEEAGDEDEEASDEEASDEEPAADEGEPEPASADDRPDVDEVFARLRSARERRSSPPADGDATTSRPAPAAVLTEDAPPAEEPEIDATVPERDAGPPEVEAQAPPDPGIAAPLAQRDDVVGPVAADMVRRCKRAIQDEQNEVLDRLRRGRGRTDVAQLLLPLSVQVTVWSDVIEPGVDEVYGAGRESVLGGDARRAPRRLVSGLAEALVTPLRERLTSSLESAMTLDLEDRVPELTARIGARYREWRAQELEARVVDVLAAAYTRGVFDAAPEDAVLQWIPAEVGRCPDADDNALEPTRRGDAFPTGQQLPPAHPGCRCLLAVVDDDS